MRGTGISFQPATAFAHSSNEPILPLGTGVTLDTPLAKDHEINTEVRDIAVVTAGYQGAPAPHQWFGGPALASAGCMVLRDAAGLVVDSFNYGSLVDPWAAEGYQGESGAGKEGNLAASPGMGRGGFGGFGGPGSQGASQPDRSAGRFPDGADTDNNGADFLVQTTTTLPVESSVGTTNIKVASVANFARGQTLIIDAGANRENAVIETVGTAGATLVRTNLEAGATVIPVANVAGFNVGQTITIDSGTNRESAVVASVAGGFRGFGGGGPGRSGATLKVTSPLTLAHAAEVQVAGSGITLTSALARPHGRGVQVANNLPTPGAPNQYSRAQQ